METTLGTSQKIPGNTAHIGLIQNNPSSVWSKRLVIDTEGNFSGLLNVSRAQSSKFLRSRLDFSLPLVKVLLELHMN